MGKDDKKDPCSEPKPCGPNIKSDTFPCIQSKQFTEDLDAKIKAAQEICDINVKSVKRTEIIQSSTVETKTLSSKAALIASKIKVPEVLLSKLPKLSLGGIRSKHKFPSNLFPKQLENLKLPANLKLPTNVQLPKIDKESVKSALNVAAKWIIANCNPTAIKEIMADNKGAAPSSRAMKYPYTFSAKVAQFPLKYYINNQWIWKYYFVSFAVCLPVFYNISKLANSPGNKAKWAEIRRKEAAEHHH